MLIYKQKKLGFTLIELLVVISIIGILASATTSFLYEARVFARDAQIDSDIKQIQLALEQFRNANGYYPAHTGATTVSALVGSGYDIRPYINTIPNNPHPGQTGGLGYRYYRSSNTEYTLLFRMDRNNFAWCSISMGTGYSAWNGLAADGGGTNYPPCY